MSLRDLESFSLEKRRLGQILPEYINISVNIRLFLVLSGGRTTGNGHKVKDKTFYLNTFTFRMAKY